MQEGGREGIWGLLGLHSFILTLLPEGTPQVPQCSLAQGSRLSGSLPGGCSGTKAGHSRRPTVDT